jgi:uncharacterized protein YggU (UPF0235/DUF167 family)
MSARPDFFKPIPTGALLFLHVTPRAKQQRLWLPAADLFAPPPHVCLSITAAPVDGQANAAVIEALHSFLHVKRSALSLVKGQQMRQKTVHIAAECVDTAWQQLQKQLNITPM